AVFTPAVSCEKSFSEMMSIGSDSPGAASNGLAENVTSPHTRSARWPAADMVMPALIDRASGALLDLRHQRNAAEAGGRKPAHHAHHRAVIHLLVAAHIDALLETTARLGDRLELGDKLVDRDFAVLQEDLALEIDRERQRLLVLVDVLRLGLGQIDRHADGEQRRRHHEDDQQHQHDVHHGRDVDLAHDGTTVVAALADRVPERAAHPHPGPPCPAYPRSSICRDSMAANAWAKPSMRWVFFFTSETNLL